MLSSKLISIECLHSIVHTSFVHSEMDEGAKDEAHSSWKGEFGGHDLRSTNP